MIYCHQDLQIKRNLFRVKVQDKCSHKRRHNLLMTLRSIGYMHCLSLPHSQKREVFKIQNRKISANLNYFGTKMFVMF